MFTNDLRSAQNDFLNLCDDISIDPEPIVKCHNELIT